MQTNPLNARSLGKSGMDALQRGDARAARAAFEFIVNADLADASICIALAYACRSLMDMDGAINAVNSALLMTAIAAAMSTRC